MQNASWWNVEECSRSLCTRPREPDSGACGPARALRASRLGLAGRARKIQPCTRILEAEIPPERIMNEFKAYASRELKPPWRRWTRSKTLGAAWKHAMAMAGPGCPRSDPVRSRGAGRAYGSVPCRTALIFRGLSACLWDCEKIAGPLPRGRGSVNDVKRLRGVTLTRRWLAFTLYENPQRTADNSPNRNNAGNLPSKRKEPDAIANLVEQRVDAAGPQPDRSVVAP